MPLGLEALAENAANPALREEIASLAQRAESGLDAVRDAVATLCSKFTPYPDL